MVAQPRQKHHACLPDCLAGKRAIGQAFEWLLMTIPFYPLIIMITVRLIRSSLTGCSIVIASNHLLLATSDNSIGCLRKRTRTLT